MPENPLELSEHGTPVPDVMQHQRAEHGVEGRVGQKRQRISKVCDAELRSLGASLPGQAKQFSARINSHDRRTTSDHFGGVQSRAAPRVEDMSPVSVAAESESIGRGRSTSGVPRRAAR